MPPRGLGSKAATTGKTPIRLPAVYNLKVRRVTHKDPAAGCETIMQSVLCTWSDSGAQEDIIAIIHLPCYFSDIVR